MSFTAPISTTQLLNFGSYDLDLPLEVDDEFWATEDPTLAFQQPSGLPSRVTAFNAWIGITQIVGFALRTLVCVSLYAHFINVLM